MNSTIYYFKGEKILKSQNTISSNEYSNSMIFNITKTFSFSKLISNSHSVKIFIITITTSSQFTEALVTAFSWLSHYLVFALSAAPHCVLLCVIVLVEGSGPQPWWWTQHCAQGTFCPHSVSMCAHWATHYSDIGIGKGTLIPICHCTFLGSAFFIA